MTSLQQRLGYRKLSCTWAGCQPQYMSGGRMGEGHTFCRNELLEKAQISLTDQT